MDLCSYVRIITLLTAKGGCIGPLNLPLHRKVYFLGLCIWVKTLYIAINQEVVWGGVCAVNVNCSGTVHLLIHRNAEKASRPAFAELMQTLSSPVTDLLSWTEEDTRIHPQAVVLGAPLEAGKDLYAELQETYIRY